MKLPKLTPELIRTVIFGAIRIGGPAITAYLGVKAGEKLYNYKYNMDYYTDEKHEPEVLYFDDLSLKEKAYFIIPAIAPVAIAATVTTVVGIIDKRADMKKIAELTSLYSLALAGEATYRKRLYAISPESGQAADEEVHKMQDKVVENTADILERSRYGGTIIFVDTLTGREFTSTDEHVKAAIARIKSEYIDESWATSIIPASLQPVYHPNRYLSMNEFYDALGIANSGLGNFLGWCSSYDKDTGTWDGNGETLDIWIEQDPKDQHRRLLCYGPNSMPVDGYWNWPD